MKRFFAAILLALSFVTVSLAQDSANLFRPTVTPPNPPCPYSRLFMNMSNQMALVSCTGTVTVIGSGGGGSGTVTSVGLSLPAIFSVSGSPVTTSGTLTATLATQTANLVFAGPTSGGAALPTFRALVSADIPSLDAAKITSGTIATARLGSGTANSTTFLRGDQTWAVPSFTLTGVWDAINPVRDHGCVGNGVADDTTCLTNAIAAAASATTGKTIYLRTGVYKTTAKLSVPGGVRIVGDGREKTIIQGNANNTVLELLAGTGVFLFEGPTVKNLSVYGSSSGANQIGITVDDQVGPDLYINGAWIENVSVYQTGSHGVYFGNAFSSTFKRIYASAPVSGYPFLFNQLNMPGNTFEGLYAQDVNVTNPAGFRIRTGDIQCWGCNGINVSGSNSWWAILGDKIGQDGALSNSSAYFSCWGCNIESSKAGGILHYSDSTSNIDGRSLFAGDASASGTYKALSYEVTTPGSGGNPSLMPKGNIGPLVVFANSPLSYYANSEVIHANDLPPVTIEGDVRQADGAIITSYRNTTNNRSEKIYRLDARKPVITIAANANYTQPGATNYEANCALGCTLTLPWAGYWASNEQLIYIRNIGVGTLVVVGNSGSTINSGGSYSLASGESVTFLPHSASADYRLVGVGGSGVANRVTYWNDVQRITSSANLTYDGTLFLNQRAGGNPYFAANDTTNGITTRFGPLAGGPDRAIIGTTSNHPLGLYANNAERWTIGTAGHLTPGAATTYNIGSASLPVNDITIGGSLYWTGTTVRDLSGSGSPEGVVTAGIGSVYRRTNGSTGTTLYVKEAGTGNTGWSAVGGGGGSGLTNLNGLTAGTQSFAVGTSGTDFAVSSVTSTHTFNLPDAGASARGVVTTGTQTIAGAKTFTSVVTANPGTTPTTGILLDINALGTDGTRDSHELMFRGRSRSGSTHLAEWKIFTDMTSNAGASKLSFQTRIDAGAFGEFFSVDDAGLVSSGDFIGDTYTANVGFIGDGSALTSLNASQLTTGIVGANRGGAGTNNGILQANGSGVVGTVTAGTGLTYSGTTLSVNQGFSPTWTAAHTFTGTMTAREIDPQTDNTYDLGTTALRWKTLHVGPGSVVVHNDATNTLKATLGFSGSTAQLVTDSATPLQIKTGSNTGVFLNTNGTIGVNLATTTSGNVDLRQLANGDTILNLRRFTDTTPTGNAIRYQSTAGTDLFLVDTTGTMTVGTVPTARLSGAVSASNMPALTGDVTTTAGTVATTIANDAVTFAKFQNITDNRLLGRSAGSTGDMQEITVGSGLSLSGGTLSASGGGGSGTVTHTAGALTANSFIFGNGTDDIKATAAATNGQLLIGSTGANPVAAALTGSSSVTVTNGAGSITLSVPSAGITNAMLAGSIDLTTKVTGTLPVGNGGTGATTFTSNGVLFGNGTSAVQATGQGAANSILTANAGAPSFSATPRIDALGIGSASSTGGLTVVGSTSARKIADLSQTFTGTSSVFGINPYVLLTLSANANTHRGIYSQVDAAGTASLTGSIVAVEGVTTVVPDSGTPSVTTATGVRGQVNVTPPGASAITNVRAFEADSGSQSLGAVTNWSQIYIKDAAKSGGTRTNQYGLFIEAQTNGGTINRSLHSAGSAFFGTTVDVVGTLTGSAINGTVINATTGFQNNGAATAGNYLRGDGTNFVSAQIASGDLPSVVVRTNQANSYSTGAQSFAGATSFTIVTAAGATPTTSAQIAYDSTSNTLEYGANSINRVVANLDEGQTFTNKTISGSSNTFSAIPVTALNPLNGLTAATPATNDVVPIYDVSATANRSVTIAELVGIATEGFIQGLNLEYVNTTTIRVTSGGAYIQSSGKIFKLTSDDDTSPSLSTSTWYYVYLFDNGGTVDTEISTTAPAAAWIGTARSKTGDTSRRYVGAFRTNSSGHIVNFLHDGSGSSVFVTWRSVISTTMRALSGGIATTNSEIDLANMVPNGTRTAYIRLFSASANNAGLRTDSDDMTGTDPAGASGYAAFTTAGGDIYLPHPINSTQKMRYAYLASPSSSGLFVDIYGYYLKR